MKVGFTCGAFDLLHAGHILMLKEAKQNCPYLVVGLQTDPTIDRKDKHKPIQSLIERMIQLQACRYVDRIIVYETEQDLEDILSFEHIDVRFTGEDHREGFMTGEKICQRRGIEIIYTKRNHRFSTSELRERIKHAKG